MSKRIVVMILLLVVSSFALLSAQARWVQYGTVTLQGHPVQNALVILEFRHAATGNWVPAYGIPEIRTDSNGNWFQPVDPTLYPHSVFDMVRATARFIRCTRCPDFTGTEAVPYDINNSIGIDIVLGLHAACPICIPRISNPPYISL